MRRGGMAQRRGTGLFQGLTGHTWAKGQRQPSVLPDPSLLCPCSSTNQTQGITTVKYNCAPNPDTPPTVQTHRTKLPGAEGSQAQSHHCLPSCISAVLVFPLSHPVSWAGKPGVLPGSSLAPATSRWLTKLLTTPSLWSLLPSTLPLTKLGPQHPWPRPPTWPRGEGQGRGPVYRQTERPS